MKLVKQIALALFVVATILSLYLFAYYRNGSNGEGYSNTNADIVKTPKTETQAYAQEIEPIQKTGYIFIGDSRFVGMDTHCNISNSDDKFVIAKVSEGHKYLVDVAMHEAYSIIKDNTDITHWKYIICLGINDLHNIDKYVETYNTIKDNIDLVIVSVNPVAYHSTISNEDIEGFNSKLQEIEGVQYIDTYSGLVDYGFGTVDGIHYTGDTYEYIYLTIGKNLKD